MDAFILGCRPNMLSSSNSQTLGKPLSQRRQKQCRIQNLRRYPLAWPLLDILGRKSQPAQTCGRDQLCQGMLVVVPKLTSSEHRRGLIWSAYELEPDDSEGAKDDTARYRRTVYDQAAWVHHRSALRHGRTILSMMGSKVVTPVFPPVSGLTLNAVALAVYNQLKESHWLPSWFPLLHVSALPFQLLAPALALLLVFRTNASYARFDEARRAWGSTVTKTRDMARKALTCMEDPADAERVNKLLRHCSETITHFFDNLGACERIFKTPIPLSYTRLTSRLLVIWHIALPLALWDECRWAIVPATALSAAVLFCIEEVGVLIEEPFEIFPLETLCNFSSKNVENLVKTHGDYHKYIKVKGDPGKMKNNLSPSV